MKKIIKITESELIRMINEIISEAPVADETKFAEPDPQLIAQNVKQNKSQGVTPKTNTQQPEVPGSQNAQVAEEEDDEDYEDYTPRRRNLKRRIGRSKY